MDELIDDDALELTSVACVEAAVDASLGTFFSELGVFLRRIESFLNACFAKSFFFDPTMDGDCTAWGDDASELSSVVCVEVDSSLGTFLFGPGGPTMDGSE